MSCKRVYLWSHPTPWSDCTSREGYLWIFQMCLLHIYIQIKLYICTFRLIINFTKNLVISWDFHTFGELPTSGFQKKVAILYQPLNNFLCYLGGAGVWLSECILFDGNNICISNKTQAVSEPSPNKKVFFLFLPSLLNCWQSLQINLSGEIENSPVLGVLSVLKLLHVFFSKTCPILKVFIQHAREAWELKDSSVIRARAFNNWQGHAKIFRKKTDSRVKRALTRKRKEILWWVQQVKWSSRIGPQMPCWQKLDYLVSYFIHSKTVACLLFQNLPWSKGCRRNFTTDI